MGLISSLKKAFSKPYATVSVAEAKDLLASGAVLIDVRSAQEWRSAPRQRPGSWPPRGIGRIRCAAAWAPGAQPANPSANTSTPFRRRKHHG